MSKLDTSAPSNDPMFQNMFNHIHIDEKWFYMTNTSEKYYLVADELPPHCTAKSKHFIEKVMFLAAVARPGWDPHQNQWFDGKIGIFPLTYKQAAH